MQSPNDDYAYRYLTLDNEMQVLLISDPDAPKAAASLDVLVGSGDNPPGRAGLAHFLEHMLFLGTDKYPDAAEYEAFVTEHGGSRNAYTSFEHTNYFFDIQAAHLPGALDRFAQFFIAPRFDEQYVGREMNAVEAEFQMGLKSDSRRGLDVLQETMNPAHPFSQFTVGSLETLADRPGAGIRDDLLAFYERHYSADMMSLVVFGAETLDELEALVAPMFEEVPNRDVEPEPISEPLFAPEELPLLLTVKPLATSRQLEVVFPIADYRSDYAANPLAYLGNLVGHEGAGSLLSRLKEEGLAEGLGAGSGLAWRGGALFNVGITLTEKGVEHYERVLQLLFTYLDMLREEGPQQWLYSEQSQLAELGFRFREQSNPVNYVAALSNGMHYYKPEDILRGSSLMSNYDEQMLAQLVRDLVPENALVTLSDSSVQTDRVSGHYEVPYGKTQVTDQQIARWTKPVEGAGLTLPQPNAFIAEDVSLVPLQEELLSDPILALSEARQSVWFGQDPEFRIPRGATYINFRSPQVGQQPDQTAAAALYAALLKDAANEFTYPAQLAGLNFDVYKHAQGLSLRVSGYTDKQQVLLGQLLEVVQNPQFSPQRFANIRADIIRTLENIDSTRPTSQVMDDLREALLHGQWGEQELVLALDTMTLADIEAYADDFWASATAETMIYGNYMPDAVAVTADLIRKILPTGEAPVMPPLKVTRLQAGEALQYPVTLSHDDSVVGWYLQARDNSWKDRAATALTGQIIKSGFFQQLRTEQQLGYVVTSFSWPQLEIPGLMLLIQSPNASAVDVVTAIDEFMAGVEASLDEEQFRRHRAALVGEIVRPHKNLWERAEFYWQSLAKKQYEFDSRQQLAATVRDLTLEQWRDYYRQVFVEQRHSLQVIAPGRFGVVPEGYGETVQDAASIRNSQDFYRID
ncbi:peptidase M16 [Kineobactrum sediminis]|uniref:Protease 3 n=1 Tax=Kineobactrum sediminis TaxID=1905677 RepID=A0A2N5Y002_9GAMM|nr:peptidase M16 [Kineobactrum sediminis]